MHIIALQEMYAHPPCLCWLRSIIHLLVPRKSNLPWTTIIIRKMPVSLITYIFQTSNILNLVSWEARTDHNWTIIFSTCRCSACGDDQGAFQIYIHIIWCWIGTGTQSKNWTSAYRVFQSDTNSQIWHLVHAKDDISLVNPADLEEVVVTLQGILWKHDLPPFTERIRHAKYHILIVNIQHNL